jgi:uncharacterized protein YjbJ (UPF0337 family)
LRCGRRVAGIYRIGPSQALIRARGAPRQTPPPQEQEPVMGLGKKAKDKAKILKGKAKKNAGKATGNKRLKAKGIAGELTGKLKLKGEKVKDAAKKH